MWIAMNLWSLYVHFNSTWSVIQATSQLLWFLHCQLLMNLGYLNMTALCDTSATEEEVLSTATHSNLNKESEASVKQSSLSTYLLKFKIEISLGHTKTLYLKAE